VNSLKVSYGGAANGVKYGYGDGVDVGGEKWTGTWATYGKNLAEGKPYTVSTPSLTNEHGAGDPENTKLTDGVVGSSYFFAKRVYEPAAAWDQDAPPEITVDLGSVQRAAAFRIHAFGEGSRDAIKGEFDDKVEVLTSTDGQNFTSRGHFDFRMRWKDVPHNLMWNDEETFKAHNFILPLAQPVEARYVKYKINPTRPIGVTELQVLDRCEFEPWDIRVALPGDAR
jgi:hypothetical protein